MFWGMSDPRYIANHAINPTTGFLESPGFLYDFDSQKKLVFLKLYRENGLKLHRTCAELGMNGDTVNKHYRNDPAFREAFDKVKVEYYDELEGVSRLNALNPRSVIERIFQLKSFFPEKYGEGKREPDVKITLNFDGNMVNVVKDRDIILDAKDLDSLSHQTQSLVPPEGTP